MYLFHLGGSRSNDQIEKSLDEWMIRFVVFFDLIAGGSTIQSRIMLFRYNPQIRITGIDYDW